MYVFSLCGACQGGWVGFKDSRQSDGRHEAITKYLYGAPVPNQGPRILESVSWRMHMST